MLGDLADDGPSSSKGEDDTEGANGAKPAKKKGKEAPEKPAKAAAGKDEEDPRVAKLKRICQQAGIPVGPHLYKQSDRVAAFTAVLEQHGLHAKSSARLLPQRSCTLACPPNPVARHSPSAKHNRFREARPFARGRGSCGTIGVT